MTSQDLSRSIARQTPNACLQDVLMKRSPALVGATRCNPVQQEMRNRLRRRGLSESSRHLRWRSGQLVHKPSASANRASWRPLAHATRSVASAREVSGSHEGRTSSPDLTALVLGKWATGA